LAEAWRLIRLVLLLAALLLGPATLAAKPPAAPVPDVPALWLVQKGESRLYLFGTVHALPRGVDWFRPHVAAALDRSQKLILETEVPDSPASLMPVILKLTRLSAARPVMDRVPESWRPTLARALDRLQPGPMDWSKTWFIALTLNNLQAMQDGIDPRIGVEAVLTERAKLKGIAIAGLETPEEQLINFDALTEADQQQLLLSTLEDLDSSKAESALLIGDWLQGNTDSLARRVNDEFEASPMLRRMLVEDRNARWAAKVWDELQQPQTLFMAVGAGHLAGKGSLIEELERRGLKVTRVAPEPPGRKRRR
jgi:hypothetical protein